MVVTEAHTESARAHDRWYPGSVMRAALGLMLSVTACRSAKPGGAVLPAPSPRVDSGAVGQGALPDAETPEAGTDPLDLANKSIQLPREQLPVGTILSLRAEIIEADTIIVGHLYAISIEARELRSRHKQTSDSIATFKDVGMNVLQGDIVEGDWIHAHHVRARLIIADSVEAVTIRKLRGALEWTSSADAGLVRNRCSPLNDPWRPANCGHWRPPLPAMPRPVPVQAPPEPVRGRRLP
jgi:hypothetical protein